LRPDARQPPALAAAPPLYLGADLSFTNEMEACGAKFLDHGKPADPFVLLKQHGGNLMRVRLWNNPTGRTTAPMTMCSRSPAPMPPGFNAARFPLFRRLGRWRQAARPAAWALMDTDAQVKALHDYTRRCSTSWPPQASFRKWSRSATKPTRRCWGAKGQPIDWARNARCSMPGFPPCARHQGPRQADPVMLHIAQPENVIPWFDDATAAGVLDYDIIGISYYSKWSKYDLAGLGKVIDAAHRRYGAQVWVVETAYAFTDDHADDTTNLLGSDSAARLSGEPKASSNSRRPDADRGRQWRQRGRLLGADWVSTKCKTRWGTGSSWENAALFDEAHHNALPAFDWLGKAYTPRAK
jgi:arabinogalactan endo-1,4-beta-galactosidase